MPFTFRPARALAAACLVVVTWLSVAPAPAAALEPPRPLPNYRPAFMTDNDQRPWKDCLWASGAMLLDKWTNGDLTRTHQQLRTLAGTVAVGPRWTTCAPPMRAWASTSVLARWRRAHHLDSLLRRLAKGAGAVLLGDDPKLPRWYGRWDYGFWKLTKKEKATKDNHAVYIERYDKRHHRVWLMDPLGRPGWKGEWISVAALRRFAWTTGGGALTVAVTPIARAAPYARVKVSNPVISTTSTTVTATFGIKAPRRWAFPGADVRATFKPVGDPLLAAATSLPVTMVASATGGAPKKPVATARGTSLRATSPLPAKAGAYRATIKLTDRRFGRTVARVGNVIVFVPGPRRATITLNVHGDTIEAGQPVSLTVAVANTGTEPWAEPARHAGPLADQLPVRETHVVAHWIQLDGAADAAPPDPVELRSVPLAPGRLATIQVRLAAPAAPGAWALVVDVVDNVDGSFAARERAGCPGLRGGVHTAGRRGPVAAGARATRWEA